MGYYYIGLDPSFAHLGIAIIDTMTQTIYLDDLTADDHHNFVLMSWSVVNLWNTIKEKYNCYINSKDTYIGQEAPISSGINSGKLNALGSIIYIEAGKDSNYENIRTYHPMKLKSFQPLILV